MRSWTILIIFAVFLVLILGLSAMTKMNTMRNPAVRIAQQYLDALTTNDVKTIVNLSSKDDVILGYDDDNVVTIKFKECFPYAGAFARQQEVTWFRMDLENLKVDSNIKPQILASEGLATVKLLGGQQMYLRAAKGTKDWKVFYITTVKEKRR